jgi:gag-polyprotein putative aspartyl protease
MAVKNRRLAGNSKLVAAAAVTSLGNPYRPASASDRETVPDEVVSYSDKGNMKMKRILITSVSAVGLICGVGSAAHATLLQCSDFHQSYGYAGRNPPATAVISHEGGYWSVHYVLQDGMTVERRSQFDVIDGSDANNTQWTGRLNKNPSKWMRGEVRQTSNGHLIYVETLFDNSNTMLAKNWIDCGPDGAPTYSPPVVAQTPAPTPTYNAGGGSGGTNGDAVPFIMVGNAIHVTVTIGDVPNDMLLDTGAAMSSVTTALADGLIARGEAHELEPAKFTMANGSSEYERVISVNSITIGSHTRTNVAMSVSDGTMLLGLPVLNAIGRFTIDAVSSQLIFG